MKRFEDKSKIKEIIAPFVGLVEESVILDWNWHRDTLTFKIRMGNKIRIYTISLFFEGEAANEEVGDFNVK